MDVLTPETPSKQKTQNEKLPCWCSIIFVVFISSIVGFTYTAFKWLPEDRPFTADPEDFIGFKARYYLSELTSIGPRVAGSNANEITAVNFLLREINTISEESKGLYTIETDVQIVSGKFRNYGMIFVYDSVQNVIVKITPKHSNHTNALLINSHFDTVATSPGAGDDGSMVAIMLGVLNSLTKSKQAVEHPIIFLLNGDEEKGLEAAHGFITQHKWARDVRSLINLDAGGIGGKEILIQTGPKNNRLIDYYNKAAKHPHGQVLAEEIFETPSFPSGTDFTVFRDYGKLTGLNMVFISNGFAYHTYMDKYSNLDEGSLQHAGDNLLALARTLANSEELDEAYVQETTERGVYFDVLGLFFINYSEKLGIAINSAISMVSLLIIGISIWVISSNTEASSSRVATQFILILIIQLGSVVFAATIVLSITFLLDHIGYTLSWLSNQWIMFGLYCCPFIFISGIIQTVFLECQFLKRLPLRFNVMLLQHSQCVLFAAVAFYLTYLQYRSTFLLSYTILFYTLSMMINLNSSSQKSTHFWLLPFIIYQAFPLILNSYIMHIIFTLIIPLTGRMPGNPDLYMADYILVTSALIMGLNIPVFNMFRNTKSVLSIFLVIFLIDFSLVFTPLGFPYTDVTPQRHLIFHITRSRSDINGQITHYDPVFADYISDRHVEQTLKDIANKNKLKYYTIGDNVENLGALRNYFGLVQGYELKIPNPSKLALISKEEIPGEIGTYRFTFRVDGSAKTLRFTIQPMGNSSLVDWTFGIANEPLEQGILQASVQFGKSSPPYTFWVVVKKKDSSSSTMSIELNSEYIDEEDQFSDGLNKFMKLFPNWSVQMGFLASYDLYEF